MKGQRVVVTCNGTKFVTVGDESKIVYFHNGTCLRYESVCERGLYFSHPLCRTETYFYKFKEVSYKNDSGSYVQHMHVLDIESAAALTVHKVQGQTLDRGIVVLEKMNNGCYVERCSSFFYVCLSRFKGPLVNTPLSSKSTPTGDGSGGQWHDKFVSAFGGDLMGSGGDVWYLTLITVLLMFIQLI